MNCRVALICLGATALAAACRPPPAPAAGPRPGLPAPAPAGPRAAPGSGAGSAGTGGAAALALALQPWVDLDALPVGAAPEAQLEAAAATDGSSWLVAWRDRRARGEEWIVAARVAPDGSLLDPVGLPVAAGLGQRSAPAVVFGGGAYLVAWQEPVGGSTALRARRVGTDGVPLGAGPITAGEVLGAPVRTAAAFDGLDFRLAWSGFEDPFFDVAYRRCSVGLATLDGGGAVVSAAGVSRDVCPEPERPALACAGEECLLAWPQGSALAVGRFTRSGATVAALATTGLAGREPSAAFTGAEYALAYERPAPAVGTSEVAGARVSTTGALLGGGPYAIAVAGDSVAPAVAFDGAGLLVAWEERGARGGGVYGRRLALDGTPRDTAALSVAAGAGGLIGPALAASPGGALVVFTDAGGDPAGDIRAARVTPEGTLPDPVPLLVSRAAASERHPAVAAGGAGWLVVFEGGRGPSLPQGVFGMRLAKDLTAIDAAPFLLSDRRGAAAAPTAVGCGDGFLVAWEDYTHGSGDVLLARVPASGPPTPAVEIAAGAAAQIAPALACGPAGAVLAWREGGAMRVARLDPAGSIRDPGGIALASSATPWRAAVAAGPSGFAVSWQDTDASSRGVISVATLSAAGTPSATTVACRAAGGRGGPGLAADAAGYQLVFSDERTAPPRLRSLRLGAGGLPDDPCGAEVPGAEAALAAVAFDGVRHSVAFERAAGGALGGAQLTPGGGVLGSFDLSDAPGAQRAPALACDGSGTCLVASERLDASVGNLRIRLRLVQSERPAPACRAAADCASGFCVDGVCCDGACGGGDPTDCLACSVAAGAPADGTCAVVARQRLCRSGSDCDAAERCDGVSSSCPADAPEVDGAACDDGDACTRSDTCRAGVCRGADPVQCGAPGECATVACEPKTGACITTPMEAGRPCDDADPCTVDDACQPPGSSVRCRGVPKVCPASVCHSGVCNPYTGACGETPWPDGSGCDDGSACTVGDHCLAGACLPGPAVRCLPPDACHQAGLCDRATGACTFAPSPDGTSCDDGDLCTSRSSCQGGACVARERVVCPGADACHEAGACDPATGACTPPVNRPDGTPCDDGDACTRVDNCVAGACVGSDPVICDAAAACRSAGVCNPLTGQCASEWSPPATPCDDGDPCTAGESCAGGACLPGPLPTCPPPDDPCLSATCATDGACGTTPVADGTACPGGRCVAGACQPSPSPEAKPKGGCSSGDAGPEALALLLALSVPWARRRAAAAPAGR